LSPCRPQGSPAAATIRFSWWHRVEAAEEDDIPMIVMFYFQAWAGILFIPWFCLKLDVKLVGSPDFQAAISELDRKIFGPCYLQGFGMNIVLPNRPL